MINTYKQAAIVCVIPYVVAVIMLLIWYNNTNVYVGSVFLFFTFLTIITMAVSWIGFLNKK